MAAAPVDIKAYVFTHDEEERRRLDGQHLIVQRAFGRDKIVKGKDGRPHPLTLHPLIEPGALRAVLDVGAGTCAAIVDVARLVHGVGEGKSDNTLDGVDTLDGINTCNGIDAPNGVNISNGPNGSRSMPGAFPESTASPAIGASLNAVTALSASIASPAASSALDGNALSSTSISTTVRASPSASIGVSTTVPGTTRQVSEDPTSTAPSPPPALFACDITSAKFPPQETLQKLGIRAFEHDIRTELPGGMAGLFSLISIRLVLVWLTVDEIRAALRNVKRALAPGGRIHLTEAQMFCFYAPEEAQLEFGSGADTSPQLNRASYLYPVNVAIQEGRRRAGLVVDTDCQLPPLLAEAGLRVLAEDRGTIPVGKMVGEMLGGAEGVDADARAKEGEEGEKLDVPRHVPYSVESFGPPSPSALTTGFDFGEKGVRTSDTAQPTVDERATTLTTHPHIWPPLPLSPPLSPTDLRTIEGATSKMFGHFAGMMREAWEMGSLRDCGGELVPPVTDEDDEATHAEKEARFKAIEERVWREFEAKGCHYGVREWVLEAV